MLLTLRTPVEERRVRLLAYAVSGSSRAKPDERRVEITTTYSKGLPRQDDADDVVLGWERNLEVFVGLDPRRLHEGGLSGNASTFVDGDALSRAANTNELVVRLRDQRLFGPRPVEYQAYFRDRYLTESLFEHVAIHAGSHVSGGPWSDLPFRRRRGPIRAPDVRTNGRSLVVARDEAPRTVPVIDDELIERLERGERTPRRVTPEEFERILRRQAENGRIGERLAMDRERQSLRTAGQKTLAISVRWIAQENVAAGYDIESYFEDGSKKYVEVKATQGDGLSFELSANEWATSARLGNSYVIVRVTGVRDHPSFRDYVDPVQLVTDGHLALEKKSLLVRPT